MGLRWGSQEGCVAAMGAVPRDRSTSLSPLLAAPRSRPETSGGRRLAVSAASRLGRAGGRSGQQRPLGLGSVGRPETERHRGWRRRAEDVRGLERSGGWRGAGEVRGVERGWRGRGKGGEGLERSGGKGGEGLERGWTPAGGGGGTLTRDREAWGGLSGAGRDGGGRWGRPGGVRATRPHLPPKPPTSQPHPAARAGDAQLAALDDLPRGSGAGWGRFLPAGGGAGAGGGGGADREHGPGAGRRAARGSPRPGVLRVGFHGSCVRASLASRYPAIAAGGSRARPVVWVVPEGVAPSVRVPLVRRRPGPGRAGDAEPEVPALCPRLGRKACPCSGAAARPPRGAPLPSAGRRRAWARGPGEKFAEAGGSLGRGPSTRPSLSHPQTRGPGAPRWAQARGPPPRSRPAGTNAAPGTPISAASARREKRADKEGLGRGRGRGRGWPSLPRKERGKARVGGSRASRTQERRGVCVLLLRMGRQPEGVHATGGC